VKKSFNIHELFAPQVQTSWKAWCAMARAVAAKGELGEEGKLFPWFAWCGLVYI
jgi:hypothetical protein